MNIRYKLKFNFPTRSTISEEFETFETAEKRAIAIAKASAHLKSVEILAIKAETIKLIIAE